MSVISSFFKVKYCDTDIVDTVSQNNDTVLQNNDSASQNNDTVYLKIMTQYYKIMTQYLKANNNNHFEIMLESSQKSERVTAGFSVLSMVSML